MHPNKPNIAKYAKYAYHIGKIVLHLLFGWSLDKDQKSLDQSKQIYALAEFKLWNLFKLVDLASVYL